MLEQRLDQVRCDVGRKAEPPILIRPGEVDQQLAGRAPGATTRKRSAKGIRDLERMRHSLEQGRERMRAIGVERHPPHAPLGIPAPSRNCAQQQPQAIVVREPKDRLSVHERRDEGRRHKHCNIEATADAAEQPQTVAAGSAITAEPACASSGRAAVGDRPARIRAPLVERTVIDAVAVHADPL